MLPRESVDNHAPEHIEKTRFVDMITLIELLSDEDDTSEAHENCFYSYILLVLKKHRSKCSIPEETKRKLIKLLNKHFMREVDHRFFNSQTISDNQSSIKNDRFTEMTKLVESEIDLRRTPHRRRTRRKLGLRRSRRHVDTSSSEDIGPPRQRQRFFQLVAEHAQLHHQCEVQREEVVQAQETIRKLSKRDKVVLWMTLAFKLTYFFEFSEFLEMANEYITNLLIIKEEHVTNNSNNLANLNLMILTTETSLTIMKELRHRKVYNEITKEILEQIYSVQEVCINGLRRMQDDVNTSEALYDHINLSLNLQDGILLEYLFIVANGWFQPTSSCKGFSALLLKSENYQWFNFKEKSNEFVVICNRLQTILHYPKPMFYREIISFLINNSNEISSSILVNFLLQCPEGFKNAISCCELIYVTTELPSPKWVEVLALHIGKCGYFDYTLNDELFETENYIVHSANDTLARIVTICTEYDVNFQNWTLMMKQFGKAQIELINSESSSFKREMSERAIFDLFLESLRTLFQQAEKEMKFNKFLWFMFRQLSKVVEYYDVKRVELVANLILNNNRLLNHSEYVEKLAAFLEQCYISADKHESFSLKSKLFHSTDNLVHDLADPINVRRNKKLQSMRHYAKIIFRAYLNDFKNDTMDRKQLKIHEDDYALFFDNLKSHIETAYAFGANNEKEIFESRACCLPYQLITFHMETCLRTRDENIVEQESEELQKEILFNVQALLNTISRNATIHFLLKIVENILAVKNARISSPIIDRMCDSFSTSVYNVVMNYQLDDVIFSLPQSHDLKQIVFRNSHNVLKSINLFKKTIIDHLANTTNDFRWIISELKKFCNADNIVPLLTFKMKNSPINSSSMKRYLEALILCSTSPAEPRFYKSVAQESNFIYHTSNSFNCVSFATWIMVPDGKDRNIFAFAFGSECTIRVTFVEDRSVVSISVFMNHNLVQSKNIAQPFLKTKQWKFLTISFKEELGVWLVKVSLNHDIKHFLIDNSSLAKKTIKNLNHLDSRWDMSDVNHTSVSIFNLFLNTRHIAALMAQGVDRTDYTNSMEFGEIASLNIGKFLAAEENMETTIFSQSDLKELKNEESRVLTEKELKMSGRGCSYHYQFTTIGSVPSFLVIFAQFLMNEADLEVQNLIVSLILNLMEKPHIDSKRWNKSMSKQILSFLLKSSFAKFDADMLGSFITHCFEFQNLLHLSSARSELAAAVQKTTDSVVRDVELLEILLSDWELWIARPEMFTVMIKCLANCVHNFNTFNIHNVFPLIKIITKSITVISEQKHDWAVNGEILALEMKRFFGIVIKSLNGPERIEAALDLWNCILLIKPASDMHVDKSQISRHNWFDKDAISHEMQSIPPLTISFDCQKAEIITPNCCANSFDDEECEKEEKASCSESSPKSVPFAVNYELNSFLNVMSFIKRSWQVSIQKVLYDLLIELVQLSPDNQRLSNDSMCTEVLIVMLTKESDSILISRIVRLYEKIINHSSTFEDQFLIAKSEQLKTLAAQLCSKSVDITVSNSLFSILFREDIDITAGLDSEHVKSFEPNLLSCQVLEPILVAFEESLNVPDGGEMFLHTCGALSSIFENNQQLAMAMIDAKLENVMVDVQFKLSHLPNNLNEKDLFNMKKSGWMSFARKIMRIGVTSSVAKIYNCAEKILKFLMLAQVQESSEKSLRQNSLLNQNLYKTLCSLFFSFLQSFIDAADVDLQEHRSASAVNTPVGSEAATPEEIDFYFVPEQSNSWTNGLLRFRDRIREKVHGNAPNLKCPYPRRAAQPMTNNEMTARVKKVIELCQIFYNTCKPPPGVFDSDASLHQSFLYSLARIVLDETMISKNPWFLTIQVEARSYLAQQIASTLFDYTRKIDRKENNLFFEVDARKIKLLTYLMKSNQTNKLKTIFGLNLNVETCIQSALLEEVVLRADNDTLAEIIVQFSEKFNLSYYHYIKNIHELKPDEKQGLIAEYDMVSQWCDENRKHGIRTILSSLLTAKIFENVTEDYRTMVNEITQHAVRIQGDARKIQYTLISRQFKREAMAKNELLKYEKNLGHLGRQFHDEIFQRTEVSAIQGPRGERLRFDDASFSLPEKFFKQPEFGAKQSLLALWESIPMQYATKSVQESSLFTCDATMALNGTYHDGVLVLTDIHIFFLTNETSPNVEISYTDILTIHQRRFELQPVAFEMFMNNHSTWFFAIKNNEELKETLSIISYRSKCKMAKQTDLEAFTKDWEMGKITNFEYIMILNTYAGRTYHDFMQYPVMPHVLSNYMDQSIDLNDSSNYRNLSKPIAIQNEKMEQRYKNYYSMLEESMLHDVHSAPYHYASLYSNLATVSYYLIRLLPHARIAIDFQDGAFDVPDRIFHNILSTFRLASGSSATDYKELIPEFFTTPEMFLNLNKMNFGACQNGEEVDHVVLPEWCEPINIDSNEFLKDSFNLAQFKANVFIAVQRHALESKYVQKNLHEWIDLIFGYKQTGAAAQQALNLYHPAVYPESIPPDECESILYAAHKANVRNIGQVPVQLFNKPHVQRSVESSSAEESAWSFDGVRGLVIGPQIYQQQVEIKELDATEEAKLSKWMHFLLGDTESSRSIPIESCSSTFFPSLHDFKSVQISLINDVIIAIDVKHKQQAEKVISQKVLASRLVTNSPTIACLLENGVIDFYKLVRKNFFGEMSIQIVFDGSIHATIGSFKDFELCPSFNAVFTISNAIVGEQFISVWDFHEKRLIRSSIFKGESLEIFGVLKHSGEMIAAEKSAYSEESLKVSTICKFSINGHLIIQQKIPHGFIDGCVSQMKPGEGISMVATLCTDFIVRIIETMTLSCVRTLDLNKFVKSLPTKICYEMDGNLLVTDESNKKWWIYRKPYSSNVSH